MLRTLLASVQYPHVVFGVTLLFDGYESSTGQKLDRSIASYAKPCSPDWNRERGDQPPPLRAAPIARPRLLPIESPRLTVKPS